MERILRRTYGVIVYQEQVIEVAAAVAGFSLAEADLLRRTMTHERSMEEMDAIGRNFVEKAMARGATQEVADEVFRQLRGFAAYGFNKAHAACFAIVCNASAWLKAHYPAEFYAGILNNQPMGFYSPRVVLNDARRFGLAVLPLDVNLSGEWFEVEKDGTALRVGLAYVKEMSAAARRAIVEARGDGAGDRRCGEERAPEGASLRSTPRRLRRRRLASLLHPPPSSAASSQARPRAGRSAARRRGWDAVRRAGPPRPYTSLADFVGRTRVSREITENLARLGAFDALGVRREELVAQVPLLYAGARAAARSPPQPAAIPASTSRGSRSTSSSGRSPSSPTGPRSGASASSSSCSASTSAPTRCASCATRSRRSGSPPWDGCPRCVTAAACASRACSSAPRCRGSAAATAPCSSRSRTRPSWARWSSSTTSTSSTDGCSRTPCTCSSTASCRTTRSTASRWWRTASPTCCTRSAARRQAAARPSVPGGLTYQRPDAWELPAVEPRTRPGRTG